MLKGFIKSLSTDPISMRLARPASSPSIIKTRVPSKESEQGELSKRLEKRGFDINKKCLRVTKTDIDSLKSPQERKDWATISERYGEILVVVKETAESTLSLDSPLSKISIVESPEGNGIHFCCGSCSSQLHHDLVKSEETNTSQNFLIIEGECGSCSNSVDALSTSKTLGQELGVSR